MMQNLILIPDHEAAERRGRIASLMREADIDLAVISDNTNKLYLTGRVFSGWLTLDADANLRAYVRRPVGLSGSEVTYVRKPEEIKLASASTIGVEKSTLAVADFERLAAMRPDARYVSISPIIRSVRAVKSEYEIGLIAQSGIKQTEVYLRLPSLYRPGMTDLEFQFEIERELRRAGCQGIFRISGDSMEFFMANILVGDNADNPTPYDFAMGGAGQSPALPVGANGTPITPGCTVMVDANGNFTGYMTDMTRTFVCGHASRYAQLAQHTSIGICRELAAMGRPGVHAADLYNRAHEMATEAGLKDYFMGHFQKAGFVGHGVGLEINEAPVIAPRSRDILAVGNVIALEPKFVIPGVGALGVENTYVVTHDGMCCLTLAPEDLRILK